jgi:hypothetical protein
MRSVHDHHESFCAGVALFFEQLSLLETYAVEDKLTHPMAVNRLSYLAHHLPPEYPANVREAAHGLAREGAEGHTDQRGIDQHWKLEVMGLARPERPQHDLPRGCRASRRRRLYLGSRIARQESGDDLGFSKSRVPRSAHFKSE